MMRILGFFVYVFVCYLLNVSSVIFWLGLVCWGLAEWVNQWQASVKKRDKNNDWMA
ncbi:MAG: hypothetical protein OHK0045_21490 [Raineya sp.]